MSFTLQTGEKPLLCSHWLQWKYLLVLFWEVSDFKHANEKSAVISSSYKELKRHSNEHQTPYVFCCSIDTRKINYIKLLLPPFCKN